MKAGEPAPGSPRCRGAGRYDSRTFPQVPVGGTLDAERKRVYAMNVGRLQLVFQRPLEGRPKTATSRRGSTGKWPVTCSGARVPSLLHGPRPGDPLALTWA